MAKRAMFRFLTLVAVSAALVVVGAQASWGGTPNSSAKLDHPGCGPKKTNGVAGNSGQHIGQPPKAQDRSDCPQ